MMAPFASRCAGVTSVVVGTKSSYTREPYVVRTPPTAARSLIGTGSPHNTPRSATGLRSSASACSCARSQHSVGNALTCGSTRSTRAARVSSRSCGLTASRRSMSTTSQADRSRRAESTVIVDHLLHKIRKESEAPLTGTAASGQRACLRASRDSAHGANAMLCYVVGKVRCLT
jgi:hypothetical protein